MAEKAEKKAEAPAAAPAAAAGHDAKKPAKEAGGGLMTKLPVLMGGAMIIEAVVLFAGFKFLGAGAHKADAIELSRPAAGTTQPGADGSTGGADSKNVELTVVDFKATNKRAGTTTFLYDVRIDVSVKAENQDKVKDAIKDQEALIKDRIRTIIAESDPEKLGGAAEPGLETLRRQVKYQLDEIVGDGMIDEVLVPKLIPYRADF